MRLLAILAVLVLALLFVSTPARADLTGADVTGTLYFPNLATVFAGPTGPVVVGPGIEFPTLAFDGTVDVTGSQIIWTATLSEHYGPGAFNGFDLLFSGAPTITNVTLDSATTLTPVGFSFTGNDVQFNLEGLSASAGQRTILDIQTSASTVPEPATLSLMLVGIGLVGLVSVMRKRMPRPLSRAS